jgi:hypothetical protein
LHWTAAATGGAAAAPGSELSWLAVKSACSYKICLETMTELLHFELLISWRPEPVWNLYLETERHVNVTILLSSLSRFADAAARLHYVVT